MVEMGKLSKVPLCVKPLTLISLPGVAPILEYQLRYPDNYQLFKSNTQSVLHNQYFWSYSQSVSPFKPFYYYALLPPTITTSNDHNHSFEQVLLFDIT